MDTILDLDQINEEVSMMEEIPANTSDYDDLLDFIDSMDAVEYEVRDYPKITSEEQANYYIRQYKRLQNDLDEIEETKKTAIKEYTDKVNAWVEARNKQIKPKMDFYSNMLECYAASLLKDSKSKSLKLIEGSIGFRKVPPSFERNDEELKEFISSLGNNGREFLIEQEPKIDWAKFKKSGQIKDEYFVYNGKPVPGITVTQKPDVFGVK